MEYKIVRSQDYLEHHGILGQKWGIRRYQNEDGTLTEEGKKRYSVSEEGSQNTKTKKKLTEAQKRKLAIAGAVAIATVAGVTIYKSKKAAYNVLELLHLNLPNDTNLEGVLKKIDDLPSKEKEVALKIGKKALNFGKKKLGQLPQKFEHAGDKAADAALAAIGTVAVTKIVNKYSDKPDSTEKEKAINKVVREAASAGINDFTKRNYSNQSNNNGQSSTPKMSEPPSKKYVDRQSQEWSDLMKNKDNKTKADIRALAKAGYDIGQIKRYLNEPPF